jgi:hypothetical protein
MTWSEDEIEALNKYDNKKDLIRILSNRSWESIRWKRRKLSLSKRKCLKWTEGEIDIIVKNYKNMVKETLLNLLPNRNWDSIKLKSATLNLNRSYDFIRKSNMSNLINDNLESFYWIGFILADGHIHDNSRIKICLSIKDIEHLEKFRVYTESSDLIIMDKMCLSSLQNKEVCPKICEKFDIRSNKTYSPPNFNLYHFNKELLFSLIVGIIDGDGSISKVFKREDSNLRIHLHKSWLNNLVFIENFIYDYFLIEKVKIYSKIGNDGYSILTLSNNTLLKEIKKECIRLNLPIMERKWDNIDENRPTRQEKYTAIKNDAIKLKKDGVKNSDIIKKLRISKGTFYKYIN